MPNINYNRGRAFEYKRKAWWEGRGYTVLRTAGSHGPFDLIAITPHDNITLIQCKRVETGAEAIRIREAFMKDPPLTKSRNYIQNIEIYVASLREVYEGSVWE